MYDNNIRMVVYVEKKFSQACWIWAFSNNIFRCACVVVSFTCTCKLFRTVWYQHFAKWSESIAFKVNPSSFLPSIKYPPTHFKTFSWRRVLPIKPCRGSGEVMCVNTTVKIIRRRRQLWSHQCIHIVVSRDEHSFKMLLAVNMHVTKKRVCDDANLYCTKFNIFFIKLTEPKIFSSRLKCNIQ